MIPINNLKKYGINPKEAVGYVNKFKKFLKITKNIRIKSNSEISENYVVFNIEGYLQEIVGDFKTYDLIYVINKGKKQCGIVYTEKLQEIVGIDLMGGLGTG